jgi:hypothetical protein
MIPRSIQVQRTTVFQATSVSRAAPGMVRRGSAGFKPARARPR